MRSRLPWRVCTRHRSLSQPPSAAMRRPARAQMRSVDFRRRMSAGGRPCGRFQNRAGAVCAAGTMTETTRGAGSAASRVAVPLPVSAFESRAWKLSQSHSWSPEGASSVELPGVPPWQGASPECGSAAATAAGVLVSRHANAQSGAPSPKRTASEMMSNARRFIGLPAMPGPATNYRSPPGFA